MEICFHSNKLYQALMGRFPGLWDQFRWSQQGVSGERLPNAVKDPVPEGEEDLDDAFDAICQSRILQVMQSAS